MNANLAPDSTAGNDNRLAQNERLAQEHTDEYSSAAKKQKVGMMNTVNTSEDQTKLSEHYRVLCVRLTAKLEKSTSKADRRKKKIQELEEENKKLKIEIEALKPKSTECGVENSHELDRAETESEPIIPDADEKVSTEVSKDDGEMKSNRHSKSSESIEIAVLKPKSTECDDNTHESNRIESRETIVDSYEKVSTDASEDDAEMKSNTCCTKSGSNWTARFCELVTYKRENGDCYVSQNDEANKSLGYWVMTQRTAFKNGKLSEERKAQLNNLGFVWELRKRVPWKTYFDELVAYKEHNGHCNVPQHDEANKSLGHWVQNQRTAFKNGKLSKQCIQQLNNLGFVWEKRVPWETNFDKLVAYKELNGHCNVSQHDEANKSLGYWVMTQRTAFKNGKLSEERKAQLNNLGFVWEKRVPWETYFDKLVAYKELNGHCNVSQHDEANKSLGHWVNNQRTAFRNGTLSDERARKLVEIGFVWRPQGQLLF